jgi:hypothetical protein
MTLETVRPAVFRTVVNWMYTGVLEFEYGSKQVDQNLYLAYDVYFWAEKYETTSLRRAILDTIITYYTTTGIFPRAQWIELVYETLPANSGLWKFLEDLFVAWYTRSDQNEALTLEYVSVFPKEVLARIVVKLAKRSSPLKDEVSLLSRNKCAYHQHKDGEDCKSGM